MIENEMYTMTPNVPITITVTCGLTYQVSITLYEMEV